MYAQLGSVRFEGLKSFDRYNLKASANITQHARIDGKPRLQKVGDNLDELTIEMLLHSRFCTPEQERSTLKASMDAGEVMPLITGAGDFVGYFVIQDLEENVMHTDTQGRTIMSRLSVNLIEHYVAGNTNLAEQAAKRTAFANASNSPVSVPFTMQSQGIGKQTMGALKVAKSETISAELALNEAKVNSSKAAVKLKQAQKSLKAAQESANKFEQNLSKLQGTINNVAQLQANIAATKTYLDNAINQAGQGDVDGALAATRSAQNGLSTVSGGAANIAVLTAIRRI